MTKFVLGLTVLALWVVQRPLSVQAQTPDADTPAAEQTERAANADTDNASEADTQPLPAAYLTLGMGATQRVIRFNAFDGPHELDTGLVPALGLSLRAGVDGNWFCHAEVTYRSSVFATAIQMPPWKGTPDQRSTLQSHSVVGGIEPGVHLGGPRSASLGLFVGYGVRALGSVLKLSSIPRFTLHGPMLRLAFELPWHAAGLLLRVSPEVQWILSQTSDLRALASTQRWGLSYGIEANLRLKLFSVLSAQLSYREARAHISSAWQTPFTDVVRYVLVEAFVRYF